MGQPPAGYPGAPGAPAKFDPAKVDPKDWVLIAMGPLALIFSLMTFYTVKASYLGFSASGTGNAWHGFFGWFGAILALAASAVVALDVLAPGQVKVAVSVSMMAVIGFGAALLCYLLAWFITPGVGGVPSAVKVDYGRGIGFYAGLLFVLVGVVLSVMRMMAEGHKQS